MYFQRFSIFIFAFSTFLVVSCGKDDPITPPLEQEDPKDEEPQSETYFSLNVDGDFYFSEIFKTGYLIIHDADGQLLEYKEYGNGDQLVFETEPGNTVTDKITITTLLHSQLGSGEDYYSVSTYSMIDKATTWNFTSTPSNYIPNGEFDIRLNNVPDWAYYDLSNKDGFGSSGSSYYKYFNNPEDAEPFIEIDNAKWFENNDLLLSVIDGNSDLKYLDIPNVQQGDSLIFDATILQPFDSYLEVVMPDYVEFYHSVTGYEDLQDFDRDALTLNSSAHYAFDDKVTNLKLGYLDRFSRFRTSLRLDREKYSYSIKRYGAKPQSINVPEQGSLSISDSTLTNFNYTTNFNFKREISIWSHRREFSDPDFSSTSWYVYAENSNNIDIYELPGEIVQKYPNIDLELLKHESTRLYLQSDSYEASIKRKWKETKIGSEYIEETMLFGETR